MPTPTIGSVDLAVTGQTVVKARTRGNEVVILEERLHSIFESGPQRTLAILQSDGRTARPFTPPEGWSVIDFTVHPSGDVSVILTTATQVRIVRLAPNGSVRSDQVFLRSRFHRRILAQLCRWRSRLTTRFNLSLMHDAARLASLGESLAAGVAHGSQRNCCVSPGPGRQRSISTSLADTGRTWCIDSHGGHHERQLRRVRTAPESSGGSLWMWTQSGPLLWVW